LTIFKNLSTNSSNLSFILEDEKRFSYNDLINDADQFGEKINERSLIFIITKNSYDCVAGYVGAVRVNAVVALINDTIHESMLKEIVKNFKPAFIYQPKNLFKSQKKWKQKFKLGKYVLFDTNIEIDYEINNNLSLLLMTSGSTSSPEFVRLSHKNIISNTKAISKYLKINSNDVAITTLPISYSYGFSIINTHLFMGASLILTDSSVVEKKFWDLLSENKATNFGGVPYTFEILKKMKFEKLAIPSIKYLTQAGGKLSQSLLVYFSNLCFQKKIDFIVMYGQTEASPRISYLPPNMLQQKLNSIGTSIPGGKLYLIDERHRVIDEPNIEGELVYEGDNVSLGYAKNCYELVKADLNNGVLNTGDIAKMDSDGYFYIVGRKKRFLKLYGNRVSLDHIEEKINEAGFDCACVGLDDQMKIYTTKESNIKKISFFIAEYFALSKSGFSISSIDILPRNDSGKVLYSELEKI